ncbi:MAG TPA: TatD family hydrolase [Terriglobales bacterium]|nr:TatD family hydrolase [Terriglobales bacterium]
MFVDSHCHLEGPKYAADRAEVVARAHQSGVAYLLAIGNGSRPEEADCGIRLAEEFGAFGLSGGASERKAPVIYATVGVHPHEAKLANAANLSQLEKWAQHPKVVGWGEIGLDYWYDFSPRDVQRRVFLDQLEMAKAAKKPVIIHCRSSKDSWDAWDECLQVLAEHWGSTGLGGIMHCFGGTLVHAKKALALGFMLSFAGNITFPKAENIREAARMAPLDQVLIETDSPYLAPVPYRGRRNEPAYVAEIARHIGDLRMMLTEEVGVQTTQNFLRFFDLQ